MAENTVLVCHDLVPVNSPLRAMLRRAMGDGALPIDHGSRIKPLPNGALLRETEARAPCRVFFARNAQLIRVGSAGERVRSLAPIVHPLLLLLRQHEQSAIIEFQRSATSPSEAAVTARVVETLWAERPAYPFVNLQSGLFAASGKADPKARPANVQDALQLARDLGEVAHLVLGDFPDLLAAGLRAALDAEGIAVRAPLAADPADHGSGDDLAGRLTRWRERLPAELFRRLCELNRADLMLLDTVMRLHAERLGGTRAELQAAREALTRAAAITGHRMADLGKPPRPKPARLEQAGPARAADDGTEQPSAQPSGGTIEPDPVLGWRNRPDAAFPQTVLGRAIVLETDGDGCRVVRGQPADGVRTLAIYGCSIAFGWGVASEETFASVLQARFPHWRVENHGVNAHGTVHNHLALERDLRWAAPDYVTFAWSGEHRIRNVADVAFVLTRTPRGSDPAARIVASESTPRACLDAEGRLEFRQVSLPRPDLLDVDLADYAADPYYLDLISFKLIESAAGLVREAGGHFFLTVVRTGLSPLLQGWLDAAGIAVVHALLPSREYTNLPDDHHPNPAGHRLYAEHIEAHLLEREAAGTRAVRQLEPAE